MFCRLLLHKAKPRLMYSIYLWSVCLGFTFSSMQDKEWWWLWYLGGVSGPWPAAKAHVLIVFIQSGLCNRADAVRVRIKQASHAALSHLYILLPSTKTTFTLIAGTSTNVKKINHLHLLWLKTLFCIRKKFTFCVPAKDLLKNSTSDWFLIQFKIYRLWLIFTFLWRRRILQLSLFILHVIHLKRDRDL